MPHYSSLPLGDHEPNWLIKFGPIINLFIARQFIFWSLILNCDCNVCKSCCQTKGHTVPTVTDIIYFHAGVLPATSSWAGRWEYKVHVCIEPLVALTQVYVLHNHMSIAQACHYNSLYIPAFQWWACHEASGATVVSGQHWVVWEGCGGQCTTIAARYTHDLS